MKEVLGRTNHGFPPVWLRLLTPDVPDGAGALVDAAIATGAPVDVSSQPPLWGPLLRGYDGPLMAVIGEELEDAPSEAHGADLTRARLIQLLSALGRERIDLLFLRVRRALDDGPLAGALEAIETARQDGHVRWTGIACEGPPLATLGLWQFHDAFDLLLAARNPMEPGALETLGHLARDRRVGIVGSRPLDWGLGAPFWLLGYEALVPDAMAWATRDHPALVTVRTPEDVALVTEAAGDPARFEAALPEIARAYRDPRRWAALRDDPRPWVRAAVRRAGS